MIDIYRDALLNGANNANSLVSAAVNAINQNGGGGSYAPFAAGTPTLGARELAETTRNNSMENSYKSNALKETARNNDLQSQYNMGSLAEAKRDNDLQQTYRMGSLANDASYHDAQIVSADKAMQMQYGDKELQNLATQTQSKAIAGIYSALAKGADIATIKRNIMTQGAQLAKGGVDPKTILDKVDAIAATLPK